MPSLQPYLNFPGNSEEAFKFYRSVFGGDFAMVMRFKDIEGGQKLSPEDQNKIMHISLPIGKGNMLMATDALESMGQKVSPGNNSYIYVDVDSEAEADKIFNNLSAGGQIEMKMEKTFWGAYFGSFRDRFGVQWMINYNYPQPAK